MTLCQICTPKPPSICHCSLKAQPNVLNNKNQLPNLLHLCPPPPATPEPELLTRAKVTVRVTKLVFYSPRYGLGWSRGF